MPNDAQKKVAILRRKTEGEGSVNARPLPAPAYGAGQPNFLDHLYRQHWHDLVGWLHRRYGAGPPDPEDVAQQAFEKIAEMEDFSNIRNPRAFLFTVAARTAQMGVRWLVQARGYVDSELKKQGGQVEDLTPERIYTARERFDLVLNTIEGLTDRQREIVMRSRIEGQTYDEISAEMGWSPAVISRELKSAMLALYRAETNEKTEIGSGQ